MVPDWRAGRRLKLRKLATRLEALAGRHVRELEEAPRVDVETLMQALQVLKMARLQAMGRRGPWPPLGRRAKRRRVETCARQRDLHRTERNAPRRRQPRPRAEGGGGDGDRGQHAGGGGRGLSAI
jgi:hypothetical protein